MFRRILVPRFSFFLLVFVFFSPNVKSQKEIRFTYKGLIKEKNITIPLNSVLHYKTAVFRSYRSSMIVNANDSIVLFAGNELLMWHDIRKIRLSRDRHLLMTFSTFFLGIGVGFFPLNTFNQIITNQKPIVSETAALVSAAFLGAGLALRECTFLRLRTGKNMRVNVIERNYERLNEPN